MRVTLNQDVCGTTGLCARLAPDVFRQREADDVGEVIEPEPAPERLNDVREAELCCPVAAITVHE